MILILGILTKWLAPKIAPNTGKEADEAKKRAREVADKAAADLEAAKGRKTLTENINPSMVDPVTVAPTPLINTKDVTKVGATTAPNEVAIDPIAAANIIKPGSVEGIGARIAGSGDDVVDAAGQGFQVDTQGRGYQNAAAQSMADTLAGRKPSVAMEQLKASQDRAAAEQLSIAAGARGGNVASARRNAAMNTSLANVEFGGQAATLRAKEIADAAQGLLGAGTQLRGQDITTETTKSQLGQEVELSNVKARDTAIQAARERLAKGEITQAQLETEIAKANADYTQRTSEKNVDTQKETKLAHAKEQLTADLASDDRLQKSFDLEAQLQLEANKGNQQAATQLAALQAQISVEVDKFNANQIQTASGKNIENRLRALQLDDSFVESMTQAWLAAEQAGNNVALDAIKVKLDQALGQAKSNEAWKTGMIDQLKMITEISSGATKPKGSDVRMKTGIAPVAGADVDGFLKAVEKTSTWQYKDPGKEGQGRKLGPMAQDIATSKLGREAVGTRPGGTMTLDYQKLAALAMAGIGRLNERLEAVEGKPRKAGPDVAGFLRAQGRAA